VTVEAELTEEQVYRRSARWTKIEFALRDPSVYVKGVCPDSGPRRGVIDVLDRRLESWAHRGLLPMAVRTHTSYNAHSALKTPVHKP
jgi:hypothetical protein